MAPGAEWRRGTSSARLPRLLGCRSPGRGRCAPPSSLKDKAAAQPNDLAADGICFRLPKWGLRKKRSKKVELIQGRGLGVMTVFSVHHTTTYRYRNPVTPGRHQMLFRPRDSFDQRLLDSRLAVTPDPVEICWIYDVFGNCVTLIDFAEPTRLLKFESVIRLEHTPENAPDFRIEDYARSHPFTYAEDELPDLATYMRRHHLGSGVDLWLNKFVTAGTNRPTGQLLMTLNEAIAEGFSYKRRVSRGTQTPDETIANSKARAGTSRC